MGRNKKVGLDYFPFDTDTFQDIKIRKLIKYQGGKAIPIYTLLLCLIYKNGYYMLWDKELPFIISEQTGFEEAYILEVINTCLSIGLFSKELYKTNNILTSKGIQIRYKEIMSLSKRKSEIVEFSLISSEKISFSSEEIGFSSEESAQRKGNKKKEEIKKEENPFSQAVNFIPIEEFRETVLNNSSRNEDARRELRCRPERLQTLIEEFETEQVAKGNGTNTDQEYRKHFINWSKIKIEKNGSEKEFSGSRYKDLT